MARCWKLLTYCRNYTALEVCHDSSWLQLLAMLNAELVKCSENLDVGVYRLVLQKNVHKWDQAFSNKCVDRVQLREQTRSCVEGAIHVHGLFLTQLGQIVCSSEEQKLVAKTGAHQKRLS